MRTNKKKKIENSVSKKSIIIFSLNRTTYLYMI